MSKIFDSIEVQDHNKRFVDKSFEIVDQIYSILEKKGMSQRDLANLLGKKESEISKWMTGTHNFTTKSITKIESVLNEDITITPQKAQKKYYHVQFVPVKPMKRAGTFTKRMVKTKEKGAKVNPNIFKKGLKVA